MTIPQWDEFFKGKEKLGAERGTEEFKRIEAMYRAYRAYYEFLNN